MDILSENAGRYKMVFRLFSFSACNPAKTEVSYDTTEGGIGFLPAPDSHYLYENENDYSLHII